jgi:hypothetical protein
MNYAGEDRSGYEARRLQARQLQARRDRNRMIKLWGGAAAVVVAIAVVIALVWTMYMNSTREVTVKINKTGQTCTNGSSCTNLVYTSGGTFKNSDSLLAGKFNSSDVTGSLCPGGVYKLKVRGYRNGLLSMWPNILQVEAVVTPPPAGSGCTNN